MRLLFWGTPLPAAEVLKCLLAANHKVLCVVTQPDRPRGRGQKITFSSVKEATLKEGLALEQPESLKENRAFKSRLESLRPDLAVVAAYGKILPQEILAIPRFGFINLHASLLPKYRGAAPIQWALLNGEAETGVTIFKLTESLDAGPIIAQKKIAVDEDDTTDTLSKKLFDAGKKLLISTLEKIEKGTALYLPQNEAEVSFAPSLTKESGEINWKESALAIHNRIRALVPWPGARTYHGGKILKLWKSSLNLPAVRPRAALLGTVVEVVKEEGFVVATGRRNLLILEVQPQGGKRMNGYAFIIGHKIAVGTVFPS
jgi:methionyl-tRNA formyltransferase